MRPVQQRIDLPLLPERAELESGPRLTVEITRNCVRFGQEMASCKAKEIHCFPQHRWPGPLVGRATKPGGSVYAWLSGSTRAPTAMRQPPSTRSYPNCQTRSSIA